MPKMAPAPTVAQIRKLLVAAAGYAAALLAYGLVPAPYDKYVSGALAFLASIGVYVTPNAQPLEEPVKYDPAANVTQTWAAPSNVHQVPHSKRLGRRPPKNAPALMFADHLKTVPDHPITDLAPQLDYPMDHNDQAGDCVIAGLDHTLQVIYTLLTGAYTNWSDTQMLTYYQTQNPAFKKWSQGGTSADQGMEIQTFLENLVKQKVILGFAKVDHTNLEQMKAAIYLGLAVVTGETLTSRNMSEQTWDYHPHDTVEGGHCTTSVGYDPKEDQVSWGAMYSMTDAFAQKNVEEAWFILTEAHVDHPAFREHFDLASFAAAYQEITGAPFPVEVPPVPIVVPPAPTPNPSPDPSADTVLAALDPATLARLTANADRRKQAVEDDAARIIAAYFK